MGLSQSESLILKKSSWLRLSKTTENQKSMNTVMTQSDDSISNQGGIGQVAVPEFEGKAVDFDPMETFPCFVPGKNFEPGMTLKGLFQYNKKATSKKNTNWQIDPETGLPTRILHVFVDGAGREYGIWSVGGLTGMMDRMAPGSYLEIKYMGKAATSLKPGQSPPHTFEFKATGPDGKKLEFDWAKKTDKSFQTSGNPVADQKPFERTQ